MLGQNSTELLFIKLRSELASYFPKKKNLKQNLTILVQLGEYNYFKSDSVRFLSNNSELKGVLSSSLGHIDFPVRHVSFYFSLPEGKGCIEDLC